MSNLKMLLTFVPIIYHTKVTIVIYPSNIYDMFHLCFVVIFHFYGNKNIFAKFRMFIFYAYPNLGMVRNM